MLRGISRAVLSGNALAMAGMVLWAGVAGATPDTKDLLIKFRNSKAVNHFANSIQSGGAKIEKLGSANWVRVELSREQLRTFSVEDIRSNPNVLAVQPNYKIRLLEDYRVHDPVLRAQLLKQLENTPEVAKQDNPPIPAGGSGGSGRDPMYDRQWGMVDNGVSNSWSRTRGQGVVVAVIDTGVDYTHEDLADNLWRNPGETGRDSQGRDKASNGVDDDRNGYIDDVVGWDFAKNDNKPFDLSVSATEILTGGGNPGHGTHCAGNVAARGNNGKGVAGVAPEAKIMAIRFLTEKGEGTTADAIKSIDYAVANGAKVLSNSWGSEGEDPADGANNQALRDSITADQNAGVLFIAAAGNGHQGAGYNNDTDAKPAYPASYDHENIISVAALDNSDALGSFSNWGARTVDIGAPGVAVFSTTVENNYSDTVIDLFGIKVTWDGTSMACPHVAGAAALYWAANPNATWRQVKDAILRTAKPVSSLRGKAVSNGKLSVQDLMR